MSLYGEYIKERLGRHIVEDERGFVTFDIYPQEKACYLVDMYVRPDFRRKGTATKHFGDQVVAAAKQAGCTRIFSTVLPKAVNSTVSVKGLLADGFELSHMDEELIWFRRDL